MPVNLWTFLSNYDTGGTWTFYPAGVGGGGDTTISNPSNISSDGISLNDLTDASQFRYCVGTAPCDDCVVVRVESSGCYNTGGTDPCADCSINILGVTTTCVGVNQVQMCVKYQANRCTDILSPDGNGWTIGAAFYNGVTNTQIDSSNAGSGFPIVNDGTVDEICWTVNLVEPFDSVNLLFTDANTGDDTRGCLSNGTGMGSGTFTYSPPSLITC